MPKRKHSEDEDSDKLLRKIRRMEKKLKKRKRRLRRQDSSSSDSSTPSNIPFARTNEDVEDLLPVYELLDDTEPSNTATNAKDASASLLLTDEVSLPGPSTALAPAPAEHTPIAATEVNTACADKNTDEDIALDEDILLFLGEVPSKEKKFGPKLQNEIANRWEHVATSGVTKDARKLFQEKYLTPENCKLIDPPALNLEVKAALSESLLKKDMAIQNKQKLITAAVSCIGQAVQRALLQNQKDPEMIKLLIDAGRIICDVQHTESMMRRGFIGSCIKKEVKDHLNGTKIDNYLFGEKLSDTLKAAKSIHKSGAEIRANTSIYKSLPKNKAPSRPLNSKTPAATNRLPLAGRRQEEPAPASPAPAPPPQRRRAPPPPPPAPRAQQRSRAPRR